MHLRTLALLLTSNFFTACVVLIFAEWAVKRWIAREDLKTQLVRKKMIEDLAAAKAHHEKSMNDFIVVNHELGIDSKALQLACHELSELVIEDSPEQFLFDGDWQKIREWLRKKAREFDRLDVTPAELNKTFVPITREGDGTVS